MKETINGDIPPQEPEVDREYVEVYPVNWSSANREMVDGMFKSESHRGVKEISLYVHIPFCPILCPFCKFNIMVYDNLLYEAYLKALHNEINLFKGHPDIDGREVTAIYFGGGTGSMLKPKDVSSLLEKMNSVFSVSADAEITIECHPNTVGEKRFAEYKAVGINRLSLGVQSFQDENLSAIGRDHTAERNTKILSAALNGDFRSVVMDLMYRLPNQSVDNLLSDLRLIAKFDPDGVSAYSLEPEDTPLGEALSIMPAGSTDREMFYLVGDFLESNGYKRFMQPDFAKVGKECKYIVNAWRAPQQLMVGFGAGAHSHYFGGHTWANVYPVRSYIEGVNGGYVPVVVGAEVDREETMARYMVLGVRGIRVDKTRFEELFGARISEVFKQQIQKLISMGWLSDIGNTYEVSRRGLYYVDNISKFFFTNKNRGATQPWLKDLYDFIPETLYERGGSR